MSPKYIGAIRGKKTDKKNAIWIADLFKHDLVAEGFMPPLAIRQLGNLMRYRFKLTMHAIISDQLFSIYFQTFIPC